MSQWRSRAFHLTRNREFIAKVALSILGIFALMAAVLHVATDTPTAKKEALPRGWEALAEETPAFKGGYDLLLKSRQPEPARLAEWLMASDSLWKILQVAGQTAQSGNNPLVFADTDLPALIKRHAVSEEQRQAFTSYAEYRVGLNGAAKATAQRELQRLAFATEPPRFANTLLADLLRSDGRREEALKALMREGRHAGAWEARLEAFDLALDLKDAESVALMSEDRELLDRLDPLSLWSAARLTQDRRLLLEAMGRMQWQRWMQSFAVPVALLAAAIWYVVLVYSASRERLRWVRYLPAVMAGVVSVWLLHWMQGTLQYGSPDTVSAPSHTHEMLDWILKVGLPEEVAKLVMFAFFLPVLLHRGSMTKAALTAGIVGLGFALDENLDYFTKDGPSAALPRLLGANFFHAAATGILGCSLYELFRSKFHRATEFLTVFLGVVVAHGLYDFCFSTLMVEWELEIMHVVILAVAARYYLRLLVAPQEKPAGWVFSRTSVFTFGLALLIGVLMVIATWQLGSLKGITLTLQGALGLAVIAYIYVREFNEV